MPQIKRMKSIQNIKNIYAGHKTGQPLMKSTFLILM